MLLRLRGCFGRSAWALVLCASLTAKRSSRSGASRGRRAAAPVISAGWRGRAGGDAAAPVIELRTAPFRCHFETATGQLAKWF